MPDLATELSRRECRAARRLARLFRIERNGGLGRWPPETAREILSRRAWLVRELAQLETRRRSLAPWVPTELELAMEALGREVRQSRDRAVGAIERLSAELRRLQRADFAAEPHDGAPHLLGRG